MIQSNQTNANVSVLTEGELTQVVGGYGRCGGHKDHRPKKAAKKDGHDKRKKHDNVAKAKKEKHFEPRKADACRPRHW